MKSRHSIVKTVGTLLAAAMILRIAAETQTDTQVSQANNLSTQSCGVYLLAPKHLCRNVDDDQPPHSADYENWDIDHDPSVDGENDLKPLTIFGTTTEEAGVEMSLTLLAGGDKVKFWRYSEELEKWLELHPSDFKWTVYPPGRQETFYVEGFKTGQVEFAAAITCGAQPSFATTKVYEVDLDIDSINDNGYAAEGYDDGEDRIEASEKEENGVMKPGKVILATPFEDYDGDGIQDYADSTIPKKKFVPLKLHLKEPFEPKYTKITLDYEESKPELAVVPQGEVAPTVPDISKGGLRLWKKDAPTTRAEADHIESKDTDGELIEHKWEDIIKNAAKVSEDKREVTLYLEYVDKEDPEVSGKKSITVTAKQGEGEEAAKCQDICNVTLTPIVIIAHEKGTHAAPGEKKAKRNGGEYGYETVMMENGNSQSSEESTERDCDLSGDLNAYRKTNDRDLVKVVLKYPTKRKLQGASLELLHDGMEVDGIKTTPATAVTINGASRIKFYKEDGTYIENPSNDLQIPDLGNPPADRYLSKIVTDGEVTLFIEGGNEFGSLPAAKCSRLGGAMLRLKINYDNMECIDKLLVYRGGFLVFTLPKTAAPLPVNGVLGSLRFYDGKGRIRHDFGGKGKEFDKDVTHMGQLITSWSARSGTNGGEDYDVTDQGGHVPPGWWRISDGGGLGKSQMDDDNKKLGEDRRITQGSYIRWRQDDENPSYATKYKYDGSEEHDRDIGLPERIGFKYNMTPILARDPQTTISSNDVAIKDVKESSNRYAIQIHPDGKQNGTGGCIGIQNFEDCKEVRAALTNYKKLTIKVIIQE